MGAVSQGLFWREVGEALPALGKLLKL